MRTSVVSFGRTSSVTASIWVELDLDLKRQVSMTSER